MPETSAEHFFNLVYKGKPNPLTPNRVSLSWVNNFAVEVSWGWSMGRPRRKLYAVTVVEAKGDQAVRRPDLSEGGLEGEVEVNRKLKALRALPVEPEQPVQ